MIRTTPFHDRTSAANSAGLWEHWSGYLVAQNDQLSEKFEHFAIRNSAGLFDSSPLYKYRVHGPDAEAFLAGVLARDIRTCAIGHGQYTAWLDDRGFVVEDGVIFRTAADEYLLTCAEPNQAHFTAFIGRRRVTIEDVSEASAVLSIQGPKSREILAYLTPVVADLPYFGLAAATIGGADVTISRTGYTGDLGYELWIPAEKAVAVWDAVADASTGRGVIPFGMVALYMARIEAGLLLLDVDFGSSRYVWTDANRSTLVELGLGWMVKDPGADDRTFVGRAALERELRDKSSRWKLTGLVLDWQDDDAKYGWYSKRPYIDTAIQSTIDPDMAPPGKHVMICFIQYAPYHLRESDWDAEKERFGDTVQATLESFSPGFGDPVLQREIRTPLDIERTVGLSEGNIFAGEFLAPQMFLFRPASAHPGGDPRLRPPSHARNA